MQWHPTARRPQASLEAYVLLVFTTICSGGNVVAGRLAVGQASPMIVTCLRWAIVSVFLVGANSSRLIAAWPELRANWRKTVLMATGGFTVFNALFYGAAHYTTAVNISILQGSIPVFVVLGAAFLGHARIGAIQSLGIAATLAGILVVAVHGQVAAIASLQVNLGDGIILIACILYSAFVLSLRKRPNISSLIFFTAMAMIAFLTSLPLVAYEVVAGTAQWPTLQGWAIVAFIAVFPSFFSQLAFMRGVQLIGPARAGLFTNLVPLFGALFAVILLGEPFGIFHLIGLALVVGGILIAETSSRFRALGSAETTQ